MGTRCVHRTHNLFDVRQRVRHNNCIPYRPFSVYKKTVGMGLNYCVYQRVSFENSYAGHKLSEMYWPFSSSRKRPEWDIGTARHETLSRERSRGRTGLLPTIDADQTGDESLVSVMEPTKDKVTRA